MLDNESSDCAAFVESLVKFKEYPDSGMLSEALLDFSKSIANADQLSVSCVAWLHKNYTTGHAEQIVEILEETMMSSEAPTQPRILKLAADLIDNSTAENGLLPSAIKPIWNDAARMSLDMSVQPMLREVAAYLCSMTIRKMADFNLTGVMESLKDDLDTAATFDDIKCHVLQALSTWMMRSKLMKFHHRQSHLQKE